MNADEQYMSEALGLAREAQSLRELLSKFNLSSDAAGAVQHAPAAAGAAPIKVAESPARALGRKLAGAFAPATNGNAALKAEEDWQEF